MIKSVFRIFWTQIKAVFQKMQNRIIRDVLFIVLSVVICLFFILLITRYLTIQDAVIELKSNNYSTALQKTNIPQAFFSMEAWKQPYNNGVVNLSSGNYPDALVNFENARNQLLSSGDSQNICKIDMNVALIHEKIAEKLKSDEKNADLLRESADVYLTAFMLRNDINTNCNKTLLNEFDASGTKYTVINDELIDSDHSFYNELIQNAYKIDGKTKVNVINSTISESLDKVAVTPDNTSLDPRINELLKGQIESKTNANSAKDLAKSDDEQKVVKPW